MKGARTGARGGASPVRLLTLTSLFPSAARPRHGIFVETRLKQIVATGHVTAQVIAPVPWFPFSHRIFGRYALLAETPTDACRNGLRVTHPRYLAVPKVGVPWHARSMARAVVRHIRAGAEWFEVPDLVGGEYLYPDGVAAAIVASEIRRPYVLTARGTDVNVLAREPRLQEPILRAIRGAATTITVSAALRDSLLDLGCDASKIVCLRNGVDLDLFRPIDRKSARSKLGIAGKRVLASIGNLVPEKRHALVINALPSITGAVYVIVGDGPERGTLERLAADRSVRERVLFLPGRNQSDLIDIYSAADVFVLPSSREGWPNVALEALACGTPVVAADVGGVREIIAGSPGSIAVDGSHWKDFADALLQLLREPPDRSAIRRHAEQFSWSTVIAAQTELYESIVVSHSLRFRQFASGEISGRSSAGASSSA